MLSIQDESAALPVFLNHAGQVADDELGEAGRGDPAVRIFELEEQRFERSTTTGCREDSPRCASSPTLCSRALSRRPARTPRARGRGEGARGARDAVVVTVRASARVLLLRVGGARASLSTGHGRSPEETLERDPGATL